MHNLIDPQFNFASSKQKDLTYSLMMTLADCDIVLFFTESKELPEKKYLGGTG